MTDPNNTTVESADSKPITSPQKTEGERKNKKPRQKNKVKKPVKRQSAVSEKFSKSSQGENRRFQLTADGLLRHFLACRVCCYFLTGVQVLYGRAVVDRMVDEFDGTWMYLPLTDETGSLLHKTYDVKVDTGDFFIEHACEVCCRRFVINLPEPADVPLVDEAESEPETDLEEPERREPIIFEPTRTREEREADWGKDRPMLLVEFKHRR